MGAVFPAEGVGFSQFQLLPGAAFLFAIYLLFFPKLFMIYFVMEIAQLKDFLDLGGVFVLSAILIYLFGIRLDRIENTNQKIIALLMLLMPDSTNHDKIKQILDENDLKVIEKMQ
jgi:hypothetical protein